MLETNFFRSRGVKVFRLSPEGADILASAMSNQGLYNAFLSLALGIGLALSNNTGHLFVLYGLLCAIVAGVCGAFSAMGRIFFVQALPAIIALVVYILALDPGCSLSF